MIIFSKNMTHIFSLYWNLIYPKDWYTVDKRSQRSLKKIEMKSQYYKCCGAIVAKPLNGVAGSSQAFLK